MVLIRRNGVPETSYFHRVILQQQTRALNYISVSEMAGLLLWCEVGLGEVEAVDCLCCCFDAR
jgi:hypothetical protein